MKHGEEGKYLQEIRSRASQKVNSLVRQIIQEIQLFKSMGIKSCGLSLKKKAIKLYIKELQEDVYPEFLQGKY